MIYKLNEKRVDIDSGFKLSQVYYTSISFAFRPQDSISFTVVEDRVKTFRHTRVFIDLINFRQGYTLPQPSIIIMK